MDNDTVDRQFDQLQLQTQQTATLIQALAAKLSADPNAREWALDLKEIALAVRDEQSTTSALLQAIHTLVDTHVQQPPQYQPLAPQQYQPAYTSQYQPAPAGGTLQRFLGGRFGQAIASGAGFGIGDDLVNSIFDRL